MLTSHQAAAMTPRDLGLSPAVRGHRLSRRVVRYESVITAMIGGALGIAVGLAIAWLMAYGLRDLGVRYALPAAQLAGFLLLAVAVGVAGAAIPARRGARTDILAAMHEE